MDSCTLPRAHDAIVRTGVCLLVLCLFAGSTYTQDSLNISHTETLLEYWGEVKAIAVFGDTVLLGVE